MSMEKYSKQDGFTLIEVIIALFILSVAILGAASMQTTSIFGNNTASRLTGAATQGENQLEILLNLPIDPAKGPPLVKEGLPKDEEFWWTDFNHTATNEGEDGLDNTDAVGKMADWGPYVFDNFTVFWNVADDYPIFGAKTIRVHIRRTDNGGVVKTVTQDFTRMEPI